MPPSPKGVKYTKLAQEDDMGTHNNKTTSRLLWFVALFELAIAVLFANHWYSHRSFSSETNKPDLVHAVVLLRGNDGVNGTVHFHQHGPLSPVRIVGKIQGLDQNALRGFHVHQYGDITDGCASASSHFNPTSQTHGAPEDFHRHVGDLGNIQSDEDGIAELDFEDKVISLTGVWSIIGRTIVVHTGTDDLGRGDNDESNKTGNAGGRAACGVIGYAPTSD